MKNILAIALVFALFGLSRCTDNQTAQEVQLVRADSVIRIPINSNANATSRNVRYFQDKGEEYLAIENEQNPSISIYRLSDCSHIKDVIPCNEGPNGIGSPMYGFDIINFDTIIVAPTGIGNRLCIIDSAATLIKNIDYPINPRPLVTVARILQSYYGLGIYKIDSVLFVCNSCRDTEENYIRMHGHPIGYRYNINTEQVSLSQELYPDISNAKPYISLGVSSVMYINGKYILYYDKGHQIFVSNGDTTWTEHLLRSKYIKDFKPKTLAGSIEAEMIQHIEEPEYRAMIYDKYRNLYYRFACPSIEVKPEDDVFTLGEFRSLFSVMIIDKDFNIIGETLMPEKTYNVNMFFVNEAGLWISTNNVENPKYEEDAINFELFILN
ncbi:MAG: DUF4221 family protein [Bacteroidales bacterium]|nr:DUF4221 family protein [Bacteroidales bacterium]